MFIFSLLDFVIGVGIGATVSVLVPAVFNWVKGKVTAVEAKANTVVASVKSAAANVNVKL